jgi:hypothetical protein
MHCKKSVAWLSAIAATISIASCCLDIITGQQQGGKSSFDGGVEAGMDAGFDAGMDAGFDAGADAGSQMCASGPVAPLASSLGLFSNLVISGPKSADLNGDGLLDLVAFDSSVQLGGHSVEIFLGLPDGGLGNPQLLNYVADVAGVGLGDLNGDGVPDILVDTSGESSYSAFQVWISDGGNFELSTTVYDLETDSFGQMAIVDLDGDGRNDIVYTAFLGWDADGGGEECGIRVIWGLADARFSSPVTVSSFVSYETAILVVGDLNGDGRPDLITGSTTFGQLRVLTNIGDGGFAASHYLLPALGGIALLPNPSGRPDLVVSLTGDALPTPAQRGIEVLHNRGDGTFTLGPVVAVGGSSIVVSDFNGDCVPDIATSWPVECGEPDGGIWVLYGDGDGGFQEPVDLPILNSDFFGLAMLGPVAGPRTLVSTGCGDGLTLYQQ